MNFPTITIPDPAAVGKWLDEQVPELCDHSAAFGKDAWRCLHYTGRSHILGTGDTPEALLSDIRRQLAENDPVAKLRKEWIAAGKPDLELPTD